MKATARWPTWRQNRAGSWVSQSRYTSAAKERIAYCDALGATYVARANSTTGRCLRPCTWGELEGIAKRTGFDLKAHTEGSGVKLAFFDEQTKEHFVPHVVEPAAGVDRAAMTFLVDAYEEQELKGEGDKVDTRTVLHFHPLIAPVTVAVFPLVKKAGYRRVRCPLTLAAITVRVGLSAWYPR